MRRSVLCVSALLLCLALLPGAAASTGVTKKWSHAHRSGERSIVSAAISSDGRYIVASTGGDLGAKT